MQGGGAGGETLFLMEMLPEQSKEHLKGLVVCGAQQPSQGSHGREFTAAHTAFTPASGRSGRWPSWATQPGDVGRQQPSQCPCPVQGGQVLIALAGHHSHLTCHCWLMLSLAHSLTLTHGQAASPLVD